MTLDSLIIGFDRALRTLTGTVTSARPVPGKELPEPALEPFERRDEPGDRLADARRRGTAWRNGARSRRTAAPLSRPPGDARGGRRHARRGLPRIGRFAFCAVWLSRPRFHARSAARRASRSAA